MAGEWEEGGSEFTVVVAHPGLLPRLVRLAAGAAVACARV